MKKSFRPLAVALSLVFAASIFCAAPAFGHGHSAKISPERAAELNRPLVPRGEKIGALLVFHGSPSPSWAVFTAQIVDRVRALNAEAETPPFAAVEGADMEFNAENDMAAGFKRLEDAGCDAVVVVPAFIFPTSHVQFDVAAILGAYSAPKMRDALKEEGIRTIRTKLPTPNF